MKSLVAFRVDSGSLLGSGHLMRCLTLAKDLQLNGINSLFVCRDLPGSLHGRVIQEGFELALLPGKGGTPPDPCPSMMHGDFLICSQNEDAEDFLKVLSLYGAVRAVMVDHYGIYRPWDEVVRKKCSQIFKIDDLADRPHLCEGLVDQNFYLGMESRYQGLVTPACALLLGPQYALLRSEFQNLPPHEASRGFHKILVSFGGADTHGYSLSVVRALLENTSAVVSVLGVTAAHQAHEWQHLNRTFSERLQLVGYVAHPVSFMRASDLFIGAGGTITWERFACGLPGIVFSIAKNQVKMAEDLSAAGFQLYAGPIDCFSAESLMDMLGKARGLAAEWQLRMRAAVDGKGTGRVVRAFGFLGSGASSDDMQKTSN